VQERVALTEVTPPNLPDPYEETVAPGTRTIYDAAGRVVRTERLHDFKVRMVLLDNGALTNVAEVVVNFPGQHAAQFDILALTQSEYDAAGRLIASIDANGNRTSYGYDEAGRRVAVTNALDQVTRYGYDENGNQTSFVDALNRETTYVYDDLNRHITAHLELTH
jgi:YD repeat-containing protein